MSTPLTAAQFRSLVREAGIPVKFYDGWETHNRGQRGDGWGKTGRNPGGVRGVMLHHTVTGDIAGTVHLCRTEGTPGVPAPLYAGLVDKTGRLHMIGWGRCNHAGLGDDEVMRAVIAERSLPAVNEANTDGNARFYGFAGINWGSGRDPWPAPQLETMAEVSALICRHHGWNERSVIGHREWQPGKPDPRAFGGGSLMDFVRPMVGKQLRDEDEGRCG